RPAPQQSAPALVVAPGEKIDCMVTGAHHMVLPTFYGNTSKWFVEGTCKNCGLVKRYPARPNMLMSMVGRPESPASARETLREQPTFDVAGVEPISPDRPATPNVALDALTHLRRGSAAAFEQLALQVEPSRLFVDVFARNLEALGHIEVGRDPHSLALTEWEVVPP